MICRTSSHRTRAIALLPAVLFAVVALISGCVSNVVDPSISGIGGRLDPGSAGFTASTPRQLIDAIVMDWIQLDWSRYADRLTDDYQFVGVEADSAGGYFRYPVLSRELEREAVARMFEFGTDHLAPFRRATLKIDPRFVAEPDSRPGKNFPWHQQVKLNYSLSADSPTGDYRVTGMAIFHVVRGDSAVIPLELVARGVEPDPNQWWLERWEDLSLQSPSLETVMPPSARQISLGHLKAIYLDDSRTASAVRR